MEMQKEDWSKLPNGDLDVIKKMVTDISNCAEVDNKFLLGFSLGRLISYITSLQEKNGQENQSNPKNN